MTYEQARQMMIQSYSKGSKGGFEVCSDVLAALGNPHKKLRVIHVAGTNGKGSTCAYLRNILTDAGYKVGMFTSPHLCNFNERINVSGTDITNDDFARMVEAVCAAYKEVFRQEPFAKDRKGATISYFELLTMMAFVYFNEQQVDIAIIEVGLGGRTDPTNIIENPLISIITKVSLDHTNVLGDNTVSIATEKCGIIKRNCPAAVFSQERTVYNIARGICLIRGSKLFYPENTQIDIIEQSLDGTRFSVSFPFDGARVSMENVRIKMLGAHQVYNAAGVINAVYALNTLGLRINGDALRSGLEKTCWAGRMQVFQGEPMIVLDGAHNPEGARVVRDCMRTYLGGRRIVLVTGILNEKDYRSILEYLTEVPDFVILTQPNYSVKACPPELLRDALPVPGKCAGVKHSCGDAMDAAIEVAGKDGVVFVSGSLYLVGDIMDYMKSVNRIGDAQ